MRARDAWPPQWYSCYKGQRPEAHRSPCFSSVNGSPRLRVARKIRSERIRSSCAGHGGISPACRPSACSSHESRPTETQTHCSAFSHLSPSQNASTRFYRCSLTPQSRGPKPPPPRDSADRLTREVKREAVSTNGPGHALQPLAVAINYPSGSWATTSRRLRPAGVAVGGAPAPLVRVAPAVVWFAPC